MLNHRFVHDIGNRLQSFTEDIQEAILTAAPEEMRIASLGGIDHFIETTFDRWI